MTSLHWGHFAIYLQSGCPEQNPGLPQWFCREVGWQEAQLQCLASWECPCFQQCCPQCSEALQRASASRLIHQTLLMGGNGTTSDKQHRLQSLKCLIQFCHVQTAQRTGGGQSSQLCITCTMQDCAVKHAGAFKGEHRLHP